eukprot:2544284-Pyramimonas_sp.AAC.1
MDLSAAFDQVDHDLAFETADHSTMPYAVMYTGYAAWKGLRICSIQGELAPPLDPCRGLTQGDSTTPCTLISTFVPWVPTSQGHAFMDDRSLVAQNTDDLDADLLMTQQFDTSIGYCENQSKRQRWSTDDPVPVRVEHLGILATPTDHT